ncbi:radical SAM protein [Candidatus Woesearchaeota archaeon]|nr:radical SAM protein [Candidatus Woesearchaeota archaeon]
MDKKKVLLINPSMMSVYEKSVLKNSFPHYPPLNLLTVAGALKQNSIPVSLLDLDLINNRELTEVLQEKLREVNPELVGVTFTTTLYSQCVKIAEIIKNYKKDIIVVAGGSHASSKPEDLITKTPYDMAVVGEGEFTLAEVMTKPKEQWNTIKGLVYKGDKGEIIKTEKRPFIKNLDEIPFPMYEIINIYNYNIPPSFRRKTPTACMETSRGCLWGCTYCNKSVFGRNFRVKSPERTVKEIEQLVSLGYKEIHIVDDMFTTNKERVKEICRLLIEKNINIIWACPNGIRADRIDRELISLMKKAGCYRVSIGAESGNQDVLNAIEKNQTPQQVEVAFKICRELGMVTHGFFMFGLPEDTEETMQQTIEFAKRCEPDIAKFGIMIPLPSTPIYEKWKEKQAITENWDDYGFHKEKPVYTHPTLSHETIKKYYKKSYREFYLRPSFIIRRVFRSLKTGQIFDDIRLVLATNWFS